MGTYLSKVGSEDKGRLVGCLSVGVCHSLLAVLFAMVAGMEIYHIIMLEMTEDIVRHQWETVLRTIIGVVVVGSYLTACTGHILSCSRQVRGSRWAETASIYVLLTSLVSFATFMGSMASHYWGKDCSHLIGESLSACVDSATLTASQWIDCSLTVILYVLVWVSFKPAQDAHKSGRAIKMAYGSIWKGWSALDYRYGCRNPRQAPLPPVYSPSMTRNTVTKGSSDESL